MLPVASQPARVCLQVPPPFLHRCLPLSLRPLEVSRVWCSRAWRIATSEAAGLCGLGVFRCSFDSANTLPSLSQLAFAAFVICFCFAANGRRFCCSRLFRALLVVLVDAASGRHIVATNGLGLGRRLAASGQLIVAIAITVTATAVITVTVKRNRP